MGREWVGWCEETAKSTAVEVAAVMKAQYPDISPGSSPPTHALSSSHNSEASDLIRRFVEVFTHHLESEILDGGANDMYSLPLLNGHMTRNGDHQDPFTARNGEPGHSHNHRKCPSSYAQSQGREGYEFMSDLEPSSAQPSRKPFYRRLWFQGFRRARFFHQQMWDEVQLNWGERRRTVDKDSRAKLAKIVVECIKEGTVHCLSGENLEGTHCQNWEKCRLCLVKTVGGYMLEFYSPPKSVKPKSGVFCFLITEARETTALEMPDRESTFVLKAENGLEYVIEAYEREEMKNWLSTIKYSMKAHLEAERSRRQNQNLRNSSYQNPPTLPPRLLQQTRGNPIRSSSSNSLNGVTNGDLRASTGSNGSGHTAGNGQTPARDIYCTLQEYPWFHGTVSRSEAARLVLEEESDAHGTFLLRQSETRIGEFVLTFNFQGKAKHLGMSLSPDGQCRVEHLWFETVFDMLEQFRLQPIPLEPGGRSDVTLTEFVVARPSLRAFNQLRQSSTDPSRPPLLPEMNMVITHPGSVRTRTESMERLQGEEASGGTSRAVENTYSFV